MDCSSSDPFIPSVDISENVVQSSSGTTEDYIQGIWKKLSVGSDGYLDRDELYKVCEDIGMQGLDDDLMEQLFEKLDSDMDGKVSFDEFLEGLFKQEIEQERLEMGKSEKLSYSPTKSLGSVEEEDLKEASSHCFSPATSSTTSPTHHQHHSVVSLTGSCREKKPKLNQEQQLSSIKDQSIDDFTSSPCYLLSLDEEKTG